jgi:cellobiose-specific phosphotransferase system component IIC
VTTSARWWVGSSEIAPENDQKTFGSLNLLAVTSCGYALSDSIGEEGLEPITFVELCSLDLLNLLAVTSCGYALSDSIGEEGLEPITFVELCSLDLPNDRHGKMEFRGLESGGQRSLSTITAVPTLQAYSGRSY